MLVGPVAGADEIVVLEGLWGGRARTAAETTRLELELSPAGEAWQARLNLLDVGVRGWPAESVELEGDRLTVVVRADSGPQTLTLHVDGARMTGDWQEPGYEEVASVGLRRLEAAPIDSERRLTIDGPAGRLGASLILPRGSGPFPGVVFLHGSGPQPRDASRWAAQALAENGVASLLYDKRGVGESEGDFTFASFDDLARDAIAAAKVLLAQPQVSAVGFAGHSQGGWIGPLAATMWPLTAFVISSAGPAVPPSRETQWPVIRAMRQGGASRAEEDAARRLFDLWHEGLRTGEWGGFDQAIAAAEGEAWFEDSGIAWLKERPDPEHLRAYRATMDFDPVPVLESLEAPLLSLLSPDDESIDAVETETILRALIEDGQRIEIQTYPGFDHAMRRLGARWPSFPERYFQRQAEFIRRQVAAADRDDLPPE